MTLFRADDSEVPTAHELLNLSGSANVLSRLDLSDTSVIGIVKSLVHYTHTFESGYDVSFQEQNVGIGARDLASCGLSKKSRLVRLT